MMKKTLALVAALALVAMATPANAEPIAVGEYYVVADGLGSQVWKETNTLDGLQTEPVIDEETGEELYPADEQVA